ncbi:peptidoglycan bridge formation glycyltransferase FemA/FemB family protein [Candidatus Gottesmanbacteria bacterium]|nr:peptidoglycan bridge formation glycyltransferase FemA/FemB family protein [Candidatus Gottesmanbacteria bacterium]
MNISIITERSVWERFWEQEAPQALFQSWLWGDVVKRQAIPVTRFGLYDGSRLIGIFQVVTVRARRGTYLHVRHGPIFSTQTLPYWASTLASLQSLAHGERAWFLRMSPQLDDSSAHRELFRSLGLIPSVTHEVDAERCLLLPLGQSEEELLAGMRKTTRYEIRRAEKVGIRVVSSTDPADLDTFFDLYRQTSKRQHFVEHKGIREEFEQYCKEGDAILLLGYHEHTLLSAAVILFSGNQAIYHHGASIPSKFPANYAVQWEAIRVAKKRGIAWYNFWGVSSRENQSHPWYGHSLFKRGFGGSERVTIHAHDVPTSGLYWVTRAIEWWEERLRGY